MFDESRKKFPELFHDGKPMVDRTNAVRTVEMKVLVFGLMRTGTTSVREALFNLGYFDVYHMLNTISNPSDVKWWHRALEAKYHGKGKFTKEDWDQILGHCQAVVDVPPAAFAEELIEAYPDAKVVILNRDVDAWYESMKKTVLAGFRGKPSLAAKVTTVGDWKYTGQLRVLIKSLMLDFFGPGGTDEENAKLVFQKYHDRIRQIVPKERLLEYRVQDGYRPLCEFLGKPVPKAIKDGKEVDAEFPKVHEGPEFLVRLQVWQKLAMLRVVKKVITAGVLISALTFAWLHWKPI